jgi:hypothetical protein
MFCKVCNTRLGATDRYCPNCGQDAPAEAAFARTSPPTPLPSADLSTARDEIDEDDMIELNDVSGEEKPRARKAKAQAKKPGKAPARKASKPAARTKAAAETDKRGSTGSDKRGATGSDKRGSTGSDKRGSTGSDERGSTGPDKRDATGSGARSPLFAPDAAGLRKLLAEMPQTLEPGLAVFRNDDGKAVGSGYMSGVGDIDLLASDDGGDLVVVMISEKGQGEELIGEVLQRVGWVRKHVGGGKKQVRGIVLCEEPPPGLSYAAAAVSDTIAFKTFRVALTFEDLEI